MFPSVLRLLHGRRRPLVEISLLSTDVPLHTLLAALGSKHSAKEKTEIAMVVCCAITLPNGISENK